MSQTSVIGDSFEARAAPDLSNETLQTNIITVQHAHERTSQRANEKAMKPRLPLPNPDNQPGIRGMV